ncbi:Mov34/MPN/PAD-1 family protein [Deinococcus altitudinis]|uniref:Mov34/MPN/PAD-1 family protein n=1 Tax=Deinococcus altitudinis TaxID=468914 RepID=UPI0038929BD0
MFTLSARAALSVEEQVLSTAWSFAQHMPRATEAGGMLIGHQPQDTTDLVLDRLTIPQPTDQRSRFRFRRSQEAHQELLDLYWMASARTRTYLGEWHTHPEDVPVPSAIDRKSWKKALAETVAFHRMGLLFMIVGRTITRIWYGASADSFPILIAEFPTGELNEQTPETRDPIHDAAYNSHAEASGLHETD